MILYFNTLSSLTEADLSQQGRFQDQPLIIADENFKLIAKTRIVNEYLSNVRKGTKLTRFLSDEAISEISNMQPQSACRSEFFTKNGNYPIVIVRNNERLLIVLDRFFSEIYKNATEVYGKLSGYDSPMLDENSPFAPCFDKAHAILGDVLASLSVIKGLPFFETVSLLQHIASRVKNIEIGRSVSFSLENEKMLTSGNERDFATAVVLMLSFLLKNENEVSIKLQKDGEIINLSVLGNGGFLPFERFELRRFLCDGDTKTDEGFFVYLVKLLSDANLWDFGVVFEENKFSGFNLQLPYIKSGDEFLLRENDFSYIDTLLQNFL